MRQIVWFVAVAMLGLASARVAAADSPTSAKFELSVDAGQHDRTNTPVAVLVAVPESLERTTAVRLLDASGKAVPAQLGPPRLDAAKHGVHDREIDFILPRLKAGESARFTAEILPADAAAPSAAASPSGDEFHWRDTPGDHTLLSFGDRPVMEYIYRPLDDSTKGNRTKTYKPFHHVYDSTGKLRLSKGPGGNDTHHRGLFYGFNRITYGDAGERRTADTWQCTGGSYESHEGFSNIEAGPVLGRHLLAIDWHGDKKDTFAHEKRELTAYDVPGGTLIEFASELSTADGPVKLDATDQHHAGFHFRALNEVASKTSGQTYFLRPDSVGKPGESRNWDPNKIDQRTVGMPWRGMSFVIGGKRYTAAIIEGPNNPKESRSSERPYGRFGASFVETVTKDRPLRVAYRFWIQDAEMKPGQIARLADDFVDPPAVTVKAE